MYLIYNITYIENAFYGTIMMVIVLPIDIQLMHLTIIRVIRAGKSKRALGIILILLYPS